MTEREITQRVALCTPDGKLNPDAVGWTRQPLHDCALPSSWGRRKRWDYWCVTAAGSALSLVYADVDYVGLVGVWFYDFTHSEKTESGAITPLGRRTSLPLTVAGGDMRFTSKRIDLSITEEPNGTRLRASFDGFDCDVLAERPSGHESLGVVIPWSDGRFQYTNKDVGRPAEGTIRTRGRRYDYGRGSDAWACLDFGRGKWPYRTKWNWGAASSATVSVQIGGKWTDGTGMTENAILSGGRITKISEDLVWTYDTNNWMRPWGIRSPSGSVDLTFHPIYDKPTRLNLGFASQKVDQCFGTYRGTVCGIDVPDIFGWAEEATWKW